MGTLIGNTLKLAINLLLLPLLAVVWLFSALTGGLVKGAVRGHMLKSVEYAVIRGVPNDFAWKMVRDRDVMKESVALMGRIDPSFRTLDAYEQYGETLIMLYKGFLNEQQG